MRVTILQTDIQWNDAPANRRGAALLMERCPSSDLYVLPEMWTTGFALDPTTVTETEGESPVTQAWMKSEAARRGAALCGSVAVKASDGKYRNREYFVTPHGRVTAYDKRHLFSPGGENSNYTAGDQRVVVEYKGVRFLLQICYDLRFPVWSRNRGDYDAIIYVANWPKTRHDAWTTLLRARAIENQCYVIGVNRVGSDPNCRYRGGSVIITPYGEVAARCDDNIQSFATADIDMEKLKKFRETFPALSDADSFSVNRSPKAET